MDLCFGELFRFLFRVLEPLFYIGECLFPSLSLAPVVVEGLIHALALKGGSDSALANEISILPWLQ